MEIKCSERYEPEYHLTITLNIPPQEDIDEGQEPTIDIEIDGIGFFEVNMFDFLRELASESAETTKIVSEWLVHWAKELLK